MYEFKSLVPTKNTKEALFVLLLLQIYCPFQQLWVADFTKLILICKTFTLLSKVFLNFSNIFLQNLLLHHFSLSQNIQTFFSTFIHVNIC